MIAPLNQDHVLTASSVGSLSLSRRHLALENRLPRTAAVRNTGVPAATTDEFANTVTHAAGLVLASVGAPALVRLALDHGTARETLGCGVFGLALVLMYAVSTLFHAIHDKPWKEWLRLFDHVCIYLLIAGTYTAVTLSSLRGPWGNTLLVVVWLCALVGIADVAKNLTRGGARLWPYVVMGWAFLIVAKPFFETVPAEVVMWIALGGFFYMAGIYFFIKETPMSHAIWHLFVMAGSACHYSAIAGSLRLA